MAVCEFGIIKGLLYQEKSVPQEIMAICEFGVIKGGDRSGGELYMENLPLLF